MNDAGSQRMGLEARVAAVTAELKVSLDLLQGTIDSSDDMIQVFEAVRDKSGEIIDFRWLLNNRTSERIYGEVRGQSLLERNPSVVVEGIFDSFKRVTETGNGEQAERHYAHEQFDGWFLQSVVKLGDGVATTTKGIDDWKAQAEILRLQEKASQAQLNESEKRFRALVTAGTYSIYRMSPDWRVMYALDSETLAPTGAPIEDWIDKYIPDEVRPEVLAEIDRAISTKSLFELEHRVRAEDGSIAWVRSRAVPIVGDDGEIVEWFGTGSDVTDRKRSEEELKASEVRLRLALEAGQIGEWELDLATDTSVRAARHDLIFGYDAPIDNWGFERFISHVVPGDRPHVEAAFQNAAETGKGWHFECRIRRANDGEIRWISARSAPQVDEKGHAVRLFGIVQDITEQRCAEAALRESEERQAFLLKLNDSLRPLADAADIRATAARLVGEHLGADRTQYGEVEGAGEQRICLIGGQFVREGKPVPDRLHYADFTRGFTGETLRRDEPVIVTDAAADPRFDDVREAWLGLDIVSLMLVPLLKQGREVAVFGVHQSRPRTWTLSEIGLVREAVDRTWDAVQRASAEAALRDNETWLAAQKEALQQIVDGAPIKSSLEILSHAAIASLGATRCAFFMLDPVSGSLKHMAGMPETYGSLVEAVKIAPDSFACGLALYDGSPVITPDVRNEPRWQEWLPVAEEYGFRGVWSFPLQTAGQANVGTMALYLAEPRAPEPRDLEIAATISRIAAIIVARHRDLADREKAETALQESEARYRQIVESAREYAIISLDEGGCITTWNSGAERLLGFGEKEAIGRSGGIFFTTEDRAARAPELEIATAEREGRAVNERWHVRKDGSRFWGSGVMLPADDAGFVKVFRDHTEERAAEGRQKLLIEELNHRVKNTLAIVQSIAQMTFNEQNSTPPGRDAFEGRLGALSGAHNLLTREFWEPVELRDVIVGALSACHGEQHLVNGTFMLLEPRSAVTVAMAVHELCTNAIKYGALSVPDGKVSVQWEIEDVSGHPQLTLVWTESGGPPVTPPTRTGFGTRMVTRALSYDLKADVTLDYLRSGLVCTIKAPVPTIAVKTGERVDAGGQAHIDR